jgi:hypothetical protein
MMQLNIFLASITFFSNLIAILAVIYLLKSNVRFTKGEMQKITLDFSYGTFFFFGALVSLFIVEALNLQNSILDFIQRIFFLISAIKFLQASLRVYKMSKVIGFASEEIPEKLKKILKKQKTIK